MSKKELPTSTKELDKDKAINPDGLKEEENEEATDTNDTACSAEFAQGCLVKE